MKRPMPLVLLVSLLASASAFAGEVSPEFKQKMAGKIARADQQQRGNDRRGNDHRGNDHRGNDHRGNDHRGNDQRGNGNHDRGRDQGRNHGSNHGNGPGGNGTRPGGDVSVHRDYRGYHERTHGNQNDRDHDRNDGRHDRDRHNYNGNHDRHRDNRGHGNGWTHYRNDWNRHPNYWDNRRHDRADYARYRYHMGGYHRPHGYYHHVWHRGHYLPHGWYSHSYVIHDWHPYRLYAPPYGYAWVRVGNDVMLTALATGLVLDVIYGIWY